MDPLFRDMSGRRLRPSFGRIPGAIHICRGVVERVVPDHAATLVLYCGGYRSALAADNLQKMSDSSVHTPAAGATPGRIRPSIGPEGLEDLLGNRRDSRAASHQ